MTESKPRPSRDLRETFERGSGEVRETKPRPSLGKKEGEKTPPMVFLCPSLCALFVPY